MKRSRLQTIEIAIEIPCGCFWSLTEFGDWDLDTRSCAHQNYDSIFKKGWLRFVHRYNRSSGKWVVA